MVKFGFGSGSRVCSLVPNFVKIAQPIKKIHAVQCLKAGDCKFEHSQWITVSAQTCNQWMHILFSVRTYGTTMHFCRTL